MASGDVANFVSAVKAVRTAGPSLTLSAAVVKPYDGLSVTDFLGADALDYVEIMAYDVS